MEELPEAEILWFYANAPKRDTRPNLKILPTPSHKLSWIPFNEKDSANLEVAYSFLTKHKNQDTLDPESIKVAVNEDYLFEVDVQPKELYPVYWSGAAFEVRRGFWFYAPDGFNKFIPCDENLSSQLENGYIKHKPWLISNVGEEADVITSVASDSTQNISVSSPKKEKRWDLYGPYMNQFSIYTSSSSGFLLQDFISSKLRSAIVTKITNADQQENYNCQIYFHYTSNKQLDDQSASSNSQERTIAVEKEEEPFISSDVLDNVQNRTTDHLILVIHGIGQQISEKLESFHFTHDTNTLRKTFKAAAIKIHADTPKDQKEKLFIPEHSGIQVLPIEWRQKLEAQYEITGKKKKDEPQQESEGNVDVVESIEQLEIPDLNQVTLEGVPGVRALVGDLVLDVLLYMTPHYRQAMVDLVVNEMNRTYQLFMRRNPDFKGKVSLYGHSLGSLLSFDILSNQPTERHTVQASRPKSAGGIDLADIANDEEPKENGDGLLNGKKKELIAPTLYKKLDFDVENFFAVGSPIGLFLLLNRRGLRAYVPDEKIPFTKTYQSNNPLNIDFERPMVKNLYNIFHPHDPIAYRMEPHIDPRFALVKPEQIVYTKGGLTGTVVGLSNGVWSAYDSLKSGIISTTTNVSSTFNKAVESMKKAPEAKKDEVEMTETAPTPIKTKEDVINDQDPFMFNNKGRVDYQLQEGVLDNPYLSALSAHSYWPDQDHAIFILKQLYSVKE